MYSLSMDSWSQERANILVDWIANGWISCCGFWSIVSILCYTRKRAGAILVNQRVLGELIVFLNTRVSLFICLHRQGMKRNTRTSGQLQQWNNKATKYEVHISLEFLHDINDSLIEMFLTGIEEWVQPQHQLHQGIDVVAHRPFILQRILRIEG